MVFDRLWEIRNYHSQEAEAPPHAFVSFSFQFRLCLICPSTWLLSSSTFFCQVSDSNRYSRVSHHHTYYHYLLSNNLAANLIVISETIKAFSEISGRWITYKFMERLSFFSTKLGQKYCGHRYKQSLIFLFEYYNHYLIFHINM